jgi:hypothetical protein
MYQLCVTCVECVARDGPAADGGNIADENKDKTDNMPHATDQPLAYEVEFLRLERIRALKRLH